jgi:hypothetical protein
MSNSIYIPDGSGGYRLSNEKPKPNDDAYTFTIPAPQIPQHLQEDFAANPQLEQALFQAIKTALDMSLSDPRTAFRNPTARSIKERIELCYETITTMRNDLAYPLKKCCDLLPQKLMDALLKGTRLDDEMAQQQDQKFWSREHENTEAQAVVSGDPINPDDDSLMENDDDAIGYENARAVAGVQDPAPRVHRRRERSAEAAGSPTDGGDDEARYLTVDERPTK